jgi:hypothetical protein
MEVVDGLKKGLDAAGDVVKDTAKVVTQVADNHGLHETKPCGKCHKDTMHSSIAGLNALHNKWRCDECDAVENY